MESVVHSQFGTVDNPVLIFTSDSSWRIVICTGPGVEDDSTAHEKMYYFVREGPIHRCQICGQCFKIVRLKDEFSELQDYYSLMFSTMSHFDVAEEDLNINLTSLFGDRP
jgi:1-deoxy-D-xylulose 5-phosphate reductoisomerase